MTLVQSTSVLLPTNYFYIPFQLTDYSPPSQLFTLHNPNLLVPLFRADAQGLRLIAPFRHQFSPLSINIIPPPTLFLHHSTVQIAFYPTTSFSCLVIRDMAHILSLSSASWGGFHVTNSAYGGWILAQMHWGLRRRSAGFARFGTEKKGKKGNVECLTFHILVRQLAFVLKSKRCEAGKS